MEVADFVFLINIENNGETKMLMVKEAKRREVDPESTDITVSAIRHPFISPQAFALKPDINENVSLSTPVYVGKRTTNFMASI